MGYYLLLLLLLVTCIYSFRKPEVGAFAYYLMSIMAPQYIWFWVFDGVPAFTIVAGSVLLAFGFTLLMNNIDLSVYKQRQNILLLIMVAFFNLSTIFSPFTNFFTSTSAELVQETLNTILIMYFVCLPFLCKEENIKKMMILFIGMIAYYVYWSNSAYFNYETFRFNNGRLPGPRFSPYNDENHFGILFVIGMPFLLFGYFHFKNILVKLALGIALLFLWHSIILTGSRGALLAVGVATLFASRLIKSKIIGILLVLGFVAAIIYQGGQLLTRTQDTIATAQQESSEEEKLDPRLQSWEVGLGLIKEYPLFGVGVQRFQQATKVHYPGYITYVAHNTFLNFAANTGLINGIIYIYFLFMHYKNFRFARNHGIQENPNLDFANNALMTALIGFYTGSMFLDLIIFEGFYFLLLLGLAKDIVFRAQLDKKREEKQLEEEVHA